MAGEFFSRITTLLRCRTSPSSSFVRIASTMLKSPIVPETITLLVRVSTPKRNGTSEVSLALAVVCSMGKNPPPPCWPPVVDCPVKSVLSMSERFVASPLTIVKTLIWASAAGRLSNCRTRPSRSSKFSGGEEITRALARASAVILTSVRIPEFSSRRVLPSSVRKRSIVARWLAFCRAAGSLALLAELPALAEGPALAELSALALLLSALGARSAADRAHHDRWISVASVCSSRMIRTSLTGPLLMLMTSICRISSATSAMSRGLACTIRELVRASGVTTTLGLKPLPAVVKKFVIVACAVVAEAYLRWKTWNCDPGTAGWSSRAASSFTVFTFSWRPTIRIALGVTKGVMFTVPCRAK